MNKFLYFHELFETTFLRKQAQLVLEQVLHCFNIVIGGKRWTSRCTSLELCLLDPQSILIIEVLVDLQKNSYNPNYTMKRQGEWL